jgi:DNA-binding NarL/FixJ family response regulator
MIYTCVVVDDESSSLAIISRLLSEFTNIEVVLITTNAIEAKFYIENNKVDLLITDMSMPILSGIALNNAVIHLCQTIFITAYTNLVIEALGKNAIDILEKPIKEELLFHAIEKAIKIIEYNKLKKANELLLAKFLKLSETEKKIILEIGRGKTNTEITNNNFIASNTLDSHKANLKNKLGLKNSQELAIFAHELLKIV